MHGTLKQNFVVFSDPLEALEALAQLIPHRRKHVVRYYGVAHPLIRQIYGLRPGEHPRIHKLPRPLLRLGRRRWARTLWLVYGIDAMQCPKCNSRMRPLATITDPDVIARILQHLGQSGSPPLPTPARAPPSSSDPVRRSEPGQQAEYQAESDPCLDLIPPHDWYIIDEA